MQRQIWLPSLVILAILLSCISANKLIDGEVAVLGQFPFLVYLQNHFEDNSVMVCSGSILSTIWVISAAHCYDPPGVLTLKAGIVNINDMGSNAQIRSVTRVINHPKYEVISIVNITMSAYDISLIQVDEPFIWTEFVKPINLENQIQEYGPEECVAAGFGFSRISDQTSYGELRYLTVNSKVIYCLKNGRLLQREDHILCSGVIGNTLYGGDSGGPLVCNNMQAGVANGYLNLKDLVSINWHTSVPYFYPWIQQIIDAYTY